MKIKQTPAKQSKNDMFTMLCKSQLQIDVQKEYVFHPTRKFRFDYAILDKKIAIEQEGGVFKKRKYVDKRTGELITTTGGRHNSATGFLNDIEKYNAATLLGWRVFRVTPEKLLTSETLNLIKQAHDQKIF